MATGEDIETQRAIDGEADAVAKQAVQIVSSVASSFVAGQVFKKTQKRAEKLLDDGLLSLNSLVHATALEFGDVGANKNLPKKLRFTKSEIASLVNKSLNTGDTLANTLTASRKNHVSRLSKEMARLNALGYDTGAIQSSIIGTKRAKYRDGFLGAMISNQETLSRTSNKMAIEVANDANRQRDPKVIGYIWKSTLDGSTSGTCQTLNGKVFYYDKSGAKPLPPAHPNCRSTTEPILDNGTKRGDIPEVESVKDWINNNPDEAREAMGATRYKLYTDGKMKIDRYTDAQFQPLTLKELKRQNSIAFDKANVELTDSGLPKGGGASTPPTPPKPPKPKKVKPPKIELNETTDDLKVKFDNHGGEDGGGVIMDKTDPYSTRVFPSTRGFRIDREDIEERADNASVSFKKSPFDRDRVAFVDMVDGMRSSEFKHLIMENEMPSQIGVFRKRGYYSPASVGDNGRQGAINIGGARSIATIRHEYGHHFDTIALKRKIADDGSSWADFMKTVRASRPFKLNSGETIDFISHEKVWISHTKAFDDALKLDFKHMDANWKFHEVERFLLDFREKNTRDGFHALSDNVDALLNGKVYHDMRLAGHGSKYYRQRGNKHVEIFANLFSAYADNDVATIKAMKKFHPNFMKVFVDEMKRLGAFVPDY